MIYSPTTGAAKLVPDEPEPFIILGVLCVIKGEYVTAHKQSSSGFSLV